MMRKRSILLAAAFLMVFCGPGCDNETSTVSQLNRDYERVITMAPSLTEIVFALGQGDRVVGVSDYTTYPPEADDQPRCGGYVNPNFEIMLSLRPDLVITQGRPGEFRAFGERYGIDIMPMEIDDLNSIYESIMDIGKTLGCVEEAHELVSDMKRQLEKVKAELNGHEPIPTLLVVGRDPSSLREVHVVGPGGFLHDFLELVGGKNIMDDLNRQYSSVSKEIVARRNPEVIIELHGEGMMSEQERRQYLKVWQNMRSLHAVENKRIYVIEETFAMLPGPRSPEIAERMAEILHGETGLSRAKTD